MKIKSCEIIGLLDRDSRIRIKLNDDLNILTGRNGAGKTSILKLIWYIISGNIYEALREVPFRRVTILTDEYDCVIHRLSGATCRIDLTIDGEATTYEDYVDDEENVFMSAEDDVNEILRPKGSSVFFPTFRRIEGGFTLNLPRPPAPARSSRAKNDIEEALLALSRRLSQDPHLFVTSISTVDISSLLLRHYADLSEVSNQAQQRVSQEIIETIKDFKSDTKDGAGIETALHLIDGIRSKVEQMESGRENIMMPITAVRVLAEHLFRNIGIRFGNRLGFGDAARAVSSDLLSAGEKQMLSFICYNAFYKDSIFFIDEPELSLHVDWQRQLFPTLRKQNSSNQFLIATHSPFIYSKYPEKEIIIDEDRGDERVFS